MCGRLLALEGDLHRYVIVVLVSRLRLLYEVDRSWSETNLLPSLVSGDGEEEAAFWSGFFWEGRVPSPALYMRLKNHFLRIAKDGAAGRGRHTDGLAGMVLVGWGRVVEGGGERYIADDELRNVLIEAGDEFRSKILWHAESRMRESEDGGENEWVASVTRLLREVWPRQKSVKTPAMSARLFGLAACSETHFPELARVIQPLLARIGADGMRLPGLTRMRGIVNRHPRAVLGLLDAVLEARVARWPSGVEGVLRRLWEADESLRGDSRLLELRRKWGAR